MKKTTNSHITEIINKPTEEHQKEYSDNYDDITDSIAEFPQMTKLYTYKHREEVMTEPSAVPLTENLAYDIFTSPSETRRDPSFCSEVTDNVTKDHQEMPIYEVIAENTSCLHCQDTSEALAKQIQ